MAFFFLPFEGALVDFDLLAFFVVSFGGSWANTAKPVSSDRPSIRLIIRFML